MILNNFPLANAIVRREIERLGWKTRIFCDHAMIPVEMEGKDKDSLYEDLKHVASPLKLDVVLGDGLSTVYLMPSGRTGACDMHGRKQAGRFVAIEGPDGVGKSTIALALDALLYERYGVIARITSAISEGSTDLGLTIGGALRAKPKTIRDGGTLWTPPGANGEQAAILAARVDQWESIVLPSLCLKKWVISDRHDLSGRAYLKEGQDAWPVEMVERAYGITPADVTFVLDLPAGHPRQVGSLNPDRNRLESRPDGFWDNLRARFLNLAMERHSTFVLDADRPVEEIVAEMEGHMIQAGWLREKQ